MNSKMIEQHDKRLIERLNEAKQQEYLDSVKIVDASDKYEEDSVDHTPINLLEKISQKKSTIPLNTTSHELNDYDEEDV